MLSDLKTVLVTGGLGFIGSNVSRYYRARGARVLGIGHGSTADKSPDETGFDRWISGDVRTTGLARLEEAVDLIVHCAGGSLVSASFGDPDAEFGKTVEAMADVLAFAREQASPPRLVVLSSAAVYGDADRLPIPESSPMKPVSPYGRAKCALEALCMEAHGLKIATIRFFSIYGRGLRKQLFWDGCRKFAGGEGQFAGSGSERRDWLHVDDAVRLIDAAAAYASEDRLVINGGTGSSLMVRDALAVLGRQWHLETGRALPALTFSGQARVGDPPGYEADIGRARAVGWMPRVKFEEGLSDYVKWVVGADR